MTNKIVRDRIYKWLEMELEKANDTVKQLALEDEPMMEHVISYQIGVADTLRRVIVQFVISGEMKPIKIKPVGNASGTMHIEKQMSDVKK
jgi:hypothetical protein